MRAWSDLDPDEQLRLREDYQIVQDREPKTCNLDRKIASFAAWLATRDIAFSAADISLKSRRAKTGRISHDGRGKL